MKAEPRILPTDRKQTAGNWAHIQANSAKIYHLIRFEGHWVLKRDGAKRALILFKNCRYGDDFEDVLSATMTHADTMKSLCVHSDSGRVIARFDREFIKLWENK